MAEIIEDIEYIKEYTHEELLVIAREQYLEAKVNIESIRTLLEQVETLDGTIDTIFGGM